MLKYVYRNRYSTYLQATTVDETTTATTVNMNSIALNDDTRLKEIVIEKWQQFQEILKTYIRQYGRLNKRQSLTKQLIVEHLSVNHNH